MTGKVGIGVGCIVNKGSQTLLMRRKNVHGAGTWSTPGGHIEFGESFEECAIRETREETGVEITDVRFAAVTNDILAKDGKHYVTIWMQAQYVAGEPRVAADYEMSEVGWFEWDNLPSPLFICFANYVEQRGYPKREG